MRRGGQRGWRSSEEGRRRRREKLHVFPARSSLGGVSWDVLPSVFKKDELLRRYQRHQGWHKDLWTSRRERDPANSPSRLRVSTTWACVCVKNRRGACFFFPLLLLSILFFSFEVGLPLLERFVTERWARGQWTSIGDLQASPLCVWDINNIHINTVTSISIHPKLNRWAWTVAFTYGKWRSSLAHVLPEPKITLFSGLHFFQGSHTSQTWLGRYSYIYYPAPPADGGPPWITWLYWTLTLFFFCFCFLYF